ncbi:hypothetical protein TWF506_010255 [Arthrobotrys conoides]|uniref:Uncharacterized protein n=1 Tax=Arthrobotrys conoides TaxID=74498 RepID=A0AAN8NAT0_9PEZI
MLLIARYHHFSHRHYHVFDLTGRATYYGRTQVPLTYSIPHNTYIASPFIGRKQRIAAAAAGHSSNRLVGFEKEEAEFWTGVLPNRAGCHTTGGRYQYLQRLRLFFYFIFPSPRQVFLSIQLGVLGNISSKQDIRGPLNFTRVRNWHIEF